MENKVERLRELRAIFSKLLFRGSTQDTADRETARLKKLLSEMAEQLDADATPKG